MHRPIISSFGEHALLLKWPTVIDTKMHVEILAWETLIKAHFEKDLLDLVATYAEIALYFKGLAPLKEITAFIKNLSVPIIISNERKPNAWVIPVCYDAEFGFDIGTVAEHNNITMDQVVALHTNQSYRIYFTGFLPGFLYLGGLADQLVTPRKKTPRLLIPKGAVAIGGSQTGIYPIDSPGGWQIIGHTPIELFNLLQTKPSPFLPGDFIQFQSITKDQLKAISAEIEAGIYTIMKKAFK